MFFSGVKELVLVNVSCIRGFEVFPDHVSYASQLSTHLQRHLRV